MSQLAPLLSNTALLIGLVVFIAVFVVGYICFVIYVVITVHNKQVAGGFDLSHDEFEERQRAFYRTQAFHGDDRA